METTIKSTALDFTNIKNKIMQKIIVTGGLGFIGSNLIELLLKNNFYVINIDKATYSSNFYNTKDFIKNYKLFTN
jgi:dTDP-D-glucose 4,6-dehydratase